ncbi:hypothetical protein CDAR_587941 [Caerostris darwini]|uniref:C2H2-type domain-containing protein n=1 Tax=Caerostris darwini TaxID=1538125 RepID=A0AAV4N1B0_9ARAC|nr:hypothetical protein CDAR_234741 [Caerostris darwini]GIY33048.1 hypothetical protein CDAR_587941 [Caerostris darwini]
MSTADTSQTTEFRTCNVCGSVFLRLDLLIDHCKERKNLPYVCEHCGTAVKYWSEFKKHQLVHSGERLHVCPVCGKAFGLKNHLKNHAEKPYYCEECKISFKSEEEFERHKLTHQREKPHVCVECRKAFVFNYELKRHMLTHTSIKGYDCKVCGTALNQLSNLKRAMGIYSKGR